MWNLSPAARDFRRSTAFQQTRRGFCPGRTSKSTRNGSQSPHGAPYTRPIDGFWLDGRLYFGGGSEAGWRRNLDQNPRACVNLEDGEQVVILHGTVAVMRTDRALAERLFEMSRAKYDESHGQSVDDYEGQDVLVFEPDVAYAWKVFFEDATRWRFGEGG